ncbi:hypothetical protein BJY00DRAFT_312625 [Aspergillus carlsbadensis]|nr:hypothetical protein BJY00DRAFT_312625 [Aspergillus carlsbadensis]
MARLSALWLASLALTSIPKITAWTLVWRNDTTSAEVLDGQDEQDCTQIWHQEGEEFSFDPEGPWCVKFYHDAQCDRSNGIDCSGRMWKQDANQNISAFVVSSMPPASMTAAGFTSDTPTPTPTPTSTTTTQTSSSTPTADTAEEDASSDGNDLSGGAIAGIVIGVLIAVALLCAASFYLGRRTGKKAATAAAAAAAAAGGTTSSSTSQPPTDPSPPSRSNTHTTTTQNPPPAPSSTSPSTSVPIYTPPDVAELPKPPVFETVSPYPQPQGYTQPPNGVRMVELPGQESGAELSSSRQVQEMGNRQIQELEGRGMEKYIP